MTLPQKVMEGLPSEIDAALVTGPFYRRYLTGFSSSAGTLVLTRRRLVFLIDSRYFEAAQQAVPDCEVILQDKPHEQIGEILTGCAVKTVAVESGVCTVKTLAEYREKLPGFEFFEDDRLSDLLDRMRQVKTEAELARMRAAQDITDRVFSRILDFIRPGLAERDIAWELERLGREMGAEGPSFSFIVSSGENSSRPHHRPGPRRVAAGDFITLDFGFLLGDYCSDMTRTVALGPLSERQRQVYGTVLAAQQAAFQVIRPGVVCREVDKAARDLIDASPFAGSFGHGLGHSLGLEVHEPPAFNKLCRTALEPGNCLSVEPGIYLAGEFGVRIEDIICCTRDGFENLTKSPKQLLIL